MNKEKDLLDIWKVRIAKESKRGDKAEAIRRANTTQTTYDRGLKQKKYFDLTAKQIEVIELHIKVLDERKEEIKQKLSHYATN